MLYMPYSYIYTYAVCSICAIATCYMLYMCYSNILHAIYVLQLHARLTLVRV